MKEFYKKWKQEASEFETQERKIVSEQIEKVNFIQINNYLTGNRKLQIFRENGNKN